MGLHRELEAIGFAVEKTGRGGRVLDVETARHVPLGRVATSMPLLELVRRRDGQRVVWDLHEHRAIDHGYATTSYRSQGRTVDSVFALASSA
jgi:ATP-dependent exoDNAse (exonuclease V) alpha subunit